MMTSKKATTIVVVTLFVGIIALVAGAIVFGLPRGLPNLFSSMVDVIGVYPVPSGRSSYVIEVMVQAPASEIAIDTFSQDGHFAYGEHYLSLDGTQISDLESEGQMTRLVFLVDGVNVERSLITPFGPVTMPNPTSIPNRLKRVIDSN